MAEPRAFIHQDQMGTVTDTTKTFQCYGRVVVNYQDARNNYSNITVETHLRTDQAWQRFEGMVYNRYIRIDGQYHYAPDEYLTICNPWNAVNDVIFQAHTLNVYHDANGDKAVDIWQRFRDASGYGPGDCYVSSVNYSWLSWLPHIDRSHMDVTFDLESVTTNSAIIRRTWSEPADWAKYRVNGGAWTNENAATPEGYFMVGDTVTGLQPDTTYTAQVSLRKTSNWLWTESPIVTFQTHPNPVEFTSQRATVLSATSARLDVTVSDPNNVERLIVAVYDGTTIVQQIENATMSQVFTNLPAGKTLQFQAAVITKRSIAERYLPITPFTLPLDTYTEVINTDGSYTKAEVYVIDEAGVMKEITIEDIEVIE